MVLCVSAIVEDAITVPWLEEEVAIEEDVHSLADRNIMDRMLCL